MAALVDLMARPFEPLTPMLVEGFALGPQIDGRRQAGLDRRRLQRHQDQLRDPRIPRRGLQRLTERRVVGRARALAAVARRVTRIVIRGRHAQSALAAYDQSAEQRGARPRRTELARPIGADLFLITRELIPADVGRHAIGQEDLGALQTRRPSSAARSAGLVATPIDRSDPINVDAGIDRITEQIPWSRESFELGIERLELDPGVFGCELPIGLGVVLVSMALPSGDFFFQSWLVGNASAQALSRQNGEFGFGHVEPTSMFGRVMPFKPVGEAARFGGGEGRVERGGRVGAELYWTRMI